MSDVVIGTSRVTFFKQLNNTPALTLALCGWMDTEQRGLGDGNLNVYSSLKALVGYTMNGRDQVPAGVITFDVQDELDRISIFQGYVLPEFRGRGVYRAMWNELVLFAMENKVSKIEGMTSMRNIAMREAAKKLGRTEKGVLLSFDVPSAQ